MAAGVDAILQWNDVMLQANANDHSLASPEQGGPILTARAFAIVSAAIYDAYNSIDRIGNAYLVTAPRATGADCDAAVAQAAHDTLVALYPGQKTDFDVALIATLDQIPNGKSEDQGRTVGSFVAQQILAVRADDGASQISTPAYVPSDLPGFHAADPLHPNQGYYATGAENIAPFAVTSLDQFEAPRLDDGTAQGRAAFLKSDEYTLAYNEVLGLGGDGVTTPTARTDEQTVIGIYWGYDGRPGLGTPPRLYNQIARTVSIQEGNTEAENARLFALVNIAMADAGLTAWNNKYDDDFWRPILGIRNGESDGNLQTSGDADWTPLGAQASNPRPGETNFTPPFPAYTSGHATFGAAAFQVLTRYYGRDDIPFTFVSDEFNGVTRGSEGQVRPVVARTFDSFTQAKLENAQSRIYLGIHWAFDRDEGIQTGDDVANYVFEHTLQPSTRNQPPRHNQKEPEDVNGDGQCTPLDALIIVNELNAGDLGSSSNYSDVNGDGQRTPLDALMVFNRLNGSVARLTAGSQDRTPVPTGEVRSLDGTGNNLTHPEWGSTDEQLLRIAPADYGNGISTPAGADRPSGREISNALAAHADEETPNDRDLTAYIYVWGQFIDHDLDLTTSASPAEPFNISVPTGDPSFDPTGAGTQVIPLNRSVSDLATGTSTSNPRQQINQITAWIDGSMIYGSDATRAAALRSFTGGKLKVQSTSVGDLPPLNTAGLADANDAHRVPANQLFLAGDVRANENIELTSMHTLFIREHNRLADQIAKANPGVSDERIYQRARSLVIAEIQSITYNQWLPALLGTSALAPYRGYNANVNPDIANEFSTAAFRLHTTINDDVEFFDNNGRPITFTYVDDQGQTVNVDGEVALFDAFFNPTLFKQTGVDGILKYAASTHAEELDNQLVDSLRNFLFGQPGQGGLDLASLNIQRGRDHGLADYNTVRAAYGLPRVQSFDQITSNSQVQAALKQLYGDVNNIDLWVGAMAENHVRGSSVGPLIQRILADQFQRLRDGDRFWYERALSGTQLDQIEHTTLADIIERNSGVQGLQDNVFFFKANASGQVFFDRNGDGVQDRRTEGGVAGIQVQLLNDEGEVVASTLTGRDGRYRFDQFGETGDYQVQVVVPSTIAVSTENPQEFLISTGNVSIRGLDFGLKLASKGTGTTGSTTTGTSPPTSTSGGFDIQFTFSGLTASEQSIFQQAAAKWESIVVGDLPDATFNGRTVDDLLISASAVAIDGSGNVLGQAGPDRVRSGSQLPYHGVMQFDTADLAVMEANGTLRGVVEHEMGHVLGIGTLWSSKGLLVGAGTSNPRFVGQQATAEYDAIFGVSATGVPVENTGGSGTRNAHWRESVFGNELMTGFVGPGTSLPISRITVASLADLGYSVNIAAADPYAPPRASSLAFVSATSSGQATSTSTGAIELPTSVVTSLASDDSATCTQAALSTPMADAGAAPDLIVASSPPSWEAAVDCVWSEDPDSLSLLSSIT